MKKYKVVVIGDPTNHGNNYEIKRFQIFNGAYTITEDTGKTHFFPINLTIIYEL